MGRDEPGPARKAISGPIRKAVVRQKTLPLELQQRVDDGTLTRHSALQDMRRDKANPGCRRRRKRKVAADLDDTGSLGSDSDDGAGNDRGSQGGGESDDTDGLQDYFTYSCECFLNY
jgi:hypothetical protein